MHTYTHTLTLTHTLAHTPIHAPPPHPTTPFPLHTNMPAPVVKKRTQVRADGLKGQRAQRAGLVQRKDCPQQQAQILAGLRLPL